MFRALPLCVSLAFAASAGAQTPPPPPAPGDPQAPSRFEEQVEVVAVTPVHGIGLPKLKIPANVQVFTASGIREASALDVPALLADRAASVQISDPQGGTFQSDVVFRGFTASPLLGAAEGLAVYQDGVRMNEPFGDTINWDALPPAAIASINLMPGSNPLFGLNALGGALSIRTKSGFDFPGHRALASTGSFGRHVLEAESGAHGRTVAYYVAGALTREAGWRDFSQSTIRRLFADLAWRGRASTLNISLTATANNLTGNGTVPLQLLEEDRSAVFTHPDLTDNDSALVTARATRQASSQLLLEGVTYVRRSRVGTFNGDAADGADTASTDPPDDVQAFDAINNTSSTRATSAGATAQITRTAPLVERENHLVMGASIDGGATRFDFASERAVLTPGRGTAGAGVYDDESFVDLYNRTITASAFATNTWSIASRVAVSASARFNATALRLRDRLGTALTGDHAFKRLNPSAGVTYQFGQGLNVYGSYAESSRVPTPVELTCADPEDPCRLPNAFVSDPPLQQIVARTWEAGLRGSTPAIDFAVAAFATAVTDDIVFVSSGALRGEGHFENIDSTRRRGIEASIELRLGRLSTSAAYTFQSSAFGSDVRMASRHHPAALSGEIFVERGDRLPGNALHSGKAAVTASVTDRLSVSATLRAQSAQFFRGDEANLLEPVSGFAVADARARHRITSRVTAVGRIHNIFAARFSTFGVLGDASLLGEQAADPRFLTPGAPRAAWLGIELQF